MMLSLVLVVGIGTTILVSSLTLYHLMGCGSLLPTLRGYRHKVLGLTVILVLPLRVLIKGQPGYLLKQGVSLTISRH